MSQVFQLMIQGDASASFQLDCGDCYVVHPKAELRMKCSSIDPDSGVADVICVGFNCIATMHRPVRKDLPSASFPSSPVMGPTFPYRPCVTLPV